MNENFIRKRQINNLIYIIRNKLKMIRGHWKRFSVNIMAYTLPFIKIQKVEIVSDVNIYYLFYTLTLCYQPKLFMGEVWKYSASNYLHK